MSDLFGIGSLINGIISGANQTAATVSNNINFANQQALQKEMYEKQLNQQKKEFNLQKEVYEYNKQQNEITRQREDTAMQRRAQDLIQAGINPIMAGLGNGANASNGQVINPFGGLSNPNYTPVSPPQWADQSTEWGKGIDRLIQGDIENKKIELTKKQIDSNIEIAKNEQNIKKNQLNKEFNQRQQQINNEIKRINNQKEQSENEIKLKERLQKEQIAWENAKQDKENIWQAFQNDKDRFFKAQQANNQQEMELAIKSMEINQQRYKTELEHKYDGQQNVRNWINGVFSWIESGTRTAKNIVESVKMGKSKGYGGAW